MNNVILFGYRGSGKTTIGRKLAHEIWKDFADVDDLTRQRFEGMTIADIWDEHGETAWRHAEAEVTRELCGRRDHVIALGGGTLMIPDARQAVEQADAVRIFLFCEPGELAQRIGADAQSIDARPNLTEKGGGLSEIEQVLAEREPVYRAVADKVFDVTHTDIEGAVRHVIKRCL